MASGGSLLPFAFVRIRPECVRIRRIRPDFDRIRANSSGIRLDSSEFVRIHPEFVGIRSSSVEFIRFGGFSFPSPFAASFGVGVPNLSENLIKMQIWGLGPRKYATLDRLLHMFTIFR